MKGFNPADMPLVIGGTSEEVERLVEWQRRAREAFANYLARMQMMCAHDEIDARFVSEWTKQQAAGIKPAQRVIAAEAEFDAFCDYAFARWACSQRGVAIMPASRVQQ